MLSTVVHHRELVEAWYKMPDDQMFHVLARAPAAASLQTVHGIQTDGRCGFLPSEFLSNDFERPPGTRLSNTMENHAVTFVDRT